MVRYAPALRRAPVQAHSSYLFTALSPNKIGPSNKGLDKSLSFV